jgi:hypothetical protein
MLARLTTEAGLPRLTAHGLRHTSATLMLAGGVPPKFAAERLGHSDPTLFTNLYSHVTPTMQREAAERIGELLFAGEQSSAPAEQADVRVRNRPSSPSGARSGGKFSNSPSGVAQFAGALLKGTQRKRNAVTSPRPLSYKRKRATECEQEAAREGARHRALNAGALAAFWVQSVRE